MTEADRREYELSFEKEHIDIPLVLFDSTASTNDEAKAYAKDHASDAVFIAERQTAGRGRLGRSFSSDGGGLYLSYLTHPDLAPKRALMLTVFAAVSLCRAIEELVPEASPTIKWVNDLRLGGRKLAGILTEGQIAPDGSLGYAVIGIGVNVRRRDYPEELLSIATDIESELGVKLSIPRLAAALVRNLSEFGSTPAAEYMEEYRRRSCVIGKRVTVIGADGAYEAEAIAITDEGELRIRLDDGNTKDLFTGEVSIKI